MRFRAQWPHENRIKTFRKVERFLHPSREESTGRISAFADDFVFAPGSQRMRIFYRMLLPATDWNKFCFKHKWNVIYGFSRFFNYENCTFVSILHSSGFWQEFIVKKQRDFC